MRKITAFLHDKDNLFFISELEEYLTLKSKDVSKMSYCELTEYINYLVSTSLNLAIKFEIKENM